VFIATGAGSGLSPVAPGTVGSFVAAIIWWFAFADLEVHFRVVAALAAFGMGTLVLELLLARRPVGDTPAIVVDEMAGTWIALLTIPKSLPWVIAGLVLFRIFDIAKPWPISLADRKIRGGIGIMFDDLLAGLAAAALLFAVEWGMG